MAPRECAGVCVRLPPMRMHSTPNRPPAPRSTRALLASALLTIACLLATACAPAVVPDSLPAQRTAQGLDLDELERLVHQEVNRVRARHGLRTLTWNASIHPVALGHSEAMRDRDRFAHVIARRDVIDRYELGGVTCRVPMDGGTYLTGGENLFLGHRVQRWRVWTDGRREPAEVNDEAALARRAVNGWMNSPGHRENMLQPAWRTEAIGVVVGTDGRVWVTQNFC